MTDRSALLAILSDLNRRAYANEEAIRRTRDYETLPALYTVRGALNAEAKTHGFVRLFDGSFRLGGSIKV